MEDANQADEWVRLRASSDEAEYHEADWADFPSDVWFDVLERYPEMAFWVAHNKEGAQRGPHDAGAARGLESPLHGRRQ